MAMADAYSFRLADQDLWLPRDEREAHTLEVAKQLEKDELMLAS